MSARVFGGIARPAGMPAFDFSNVRGPALPAIGDYAAFLDRLATPLTIAQELKVRLAWKLLHTDDLWDKLDVVTGGLGSMADSLLNWKDTAYTATAHLSPAVPVPPAAEVPAWTEATGFNFDGVDDYIDTNFNPSTAPGTAYSLTSAHVALLVTATPGNTTTYVLGTAVNGTRARLLARAGTVNGRLNGATGVPNGTSADGKGVWAIERAGTEAGAVGHDLRLYRNGTVVTQITAAPDVLPAASLTIGRDYLIFSPNRVKAWTIGGALTARERAARDAALDVLA